MSFDKIKAMRNAQRYVQNGKIRNAIEEYKKIVENDPSDFNVVNTLGDLYVRASMKKEALNCFTQAGEHYLSHGYSQKAIAIFNKVSRLDPDSLAVNEKLAALYYDRHCHTEAREYYTKVAKVYEEKGRKADALKAWTFVAQLDPEDTETLLKVGDAYLKNGQQNEAANAFCEAGERLVEQKKYDYAVTAYKRALEAKPENAATRRALVAAQLNIGFGDEAAEMLEESLLLDPNDRESMGMLADCYLKIGNPIEAERVIVRLLELEPSAYLRFLGLVEGYLKVNDVNSSVRILSMTLEHLLIGGYTDELEKWLAEILARDRDNLDANRINVRLYQFRRDEEKSKEALEHFLEVAETQNSVEDQRSALTQLVTLFPYETLYAHRLELLIGVQEAAALKTAAKERHKEPAGEVPTFESFEKLAQDDETTGIDSGNFSNSYDDGEYVGETLVATIVDEDKPIPKPEGLGLNGDEPARSEPAIIRFTAKEPEENEGEPMTLSMFQERRIAEELESIAYFVNQGFSDLAEKSLISLEGEFGPRPEILAMRQAIKAGSGLSSDVLSKDEVKSPQNTESETSAGANESNTDSHGFAVLPASDVETTPDNPENFEHASKGLLRNDSEIEQEENLTPSSQLAVPRFETSENSIEQDESATIKSSETKEAIEVSTNAREEEAAAIVASNESAVSAGANAEDSKSNSAKETTSVESENTGKVAPTVEGLYDPKSEVETSSPMETHAQPQPETSAWRGFDTSAIVEAANRAARFEAEQKEALRIKAERLKAQKIEAERIEAERIETERLQVQKIEAERIKAARLEIEKLEAEKLQVARLEAAKIEAAKLAAEKLVAEKLEAEKISVATEGSLEIPSEESVVRDVDEINLDFDELLAERKQEAKFALEFDLPKEIAAPAKQFPKYVDLRNELGLDDSAGELEDDFETHFELGTAYKEMGLFVEAIREFQSAIERVKANDGTRRHFECCNSIGYCFMQQQLPRIALRWFEKAYETKDLNMNERHALSYEIGCVYFAEGNFDKAAELFEEILTVDVGYRDVRERLEKMKITA